jgi:predicted CxxxxCH...CXXCH cytochrome family protein
MTRALLIAFVLAGCGEARPVTSGTHACINWKDTIGTELANRCVTCHGPGATFDASSYVTAIVNPPKLAEMMSAPDATHRLVADVAPDIVQWVNQCDVAYLESSVHPRGLMNPADPDFHGTQVKNRGWNMSVCAGCHGSDFSGGAANASCRTCHEGGPTGCTTCHGQPPKTGAHVAHVVEGGLARPFDCTECHTKPLLYTDVGHLFRADGSVIDKAAITFGAQAQAHGAAPAYDGSSCQNVYCHGATFSDTSAKSRAPAWKGGAAEAACGTCHGIPPSSHALTDCAFCHPKVIDANKQLIDKTRHVDGVVSLGDESGTCFACHALPPPTGAHAAHLQAPHALRGGLSCGNCHVVPTTVTSAGHIDGSPVALGPMIIGLASKSGMATYDRASNTCKNVYCHGGNDVTWVADVTQIECGSCHGIPPSDAAHASKPTFDKCYTCHPQTMNATGAFITGGGHLNGVVDVAP